MDSKLLFRDPLYLYQIMGFPLDYQKGIKGNLLKLLAIFTYFSVITNLIYHIYYLSVKANNIDEFAFVTTFCLTKTENIVILTTFNLWRAEYKFLIDEICKITERSICEAENLQLEC